MATTTKVSREEQLLRDLDDTVQNLRISICKGHCDDFHDYRYMTGQLVAYNDVRDRLERFFIEIGDDDD